MNKINIMYCCCIEYVGETLEKNILDQSTINYSIITNILSKRFEKNVIFLAPIQDKCLNCFVKIRLTDYYLFYNNCVRLSVGYSFATFYDIFKLNSISIV